MGFKPSENSGLPVQYVIFLGLVTDSRDMTFNIPDPKIARVIKWDSELLEQREVPVRNLTGFVGLLQPLRTATGSIVSVMTRSLYKVISQAKSWSSLGKISGLVHLRPINHQKIMRLMLKLVSSKIQ